MKGDNYMNDYILALNAAIFAIMRIEEKGSTSSTVKDRNGEWHTMSWANCILQLYKIIEEKAGDKK